MQFPVSFKMYSNNNCIRQTNMFQIIKQEAGFSTRVTKYLHFHQFNGINLLIIFRICKQATLWGGNVI